jgi:hypothetical protein
MRHDLRKIYKSKIANVPTPGYSGHTSVFTKPISYINLDRINDAYEKDLQIPKKLGDDLPDGFRSSLGLESSCDNGEVFL